MYKNVFTNNVSDNRILETCLGKLWVFIFEYSTVVEKKKLGSTWMTHKHIELKAKVLIRQDEGYIKI